VTRKVSFSSSAAFGSCHCCMSFPVNLLHHLLFSNVSLNDSETHLSNVSSGTTSRGRRASLMLHVKLAGLVDERAFVVPRSTCTSRAIKGMLGEECGSCTVAGSSVARMLPNQRPGDTNLHS
jgi:hypothetical protein